MCGHIQREQVSFYDACPTPAPVFSSALLHVHLHAATCCHVLQHLPCPSLSPLHTSPVTHHTPQVLVAHRPEVKLQSVAVSQNWLMIQERYKAQQAVQVYRLPQDGSMPQSLGAGERMEFDEPAYDLSGGKFTGLTGLIGRSPGVRERCQQHCPWPSPAAGRVSRYQTPLLVLTNSRRHDALQHVHGRMGCNENLALVYWSAC